MSLNPEDNATSDTARCGCVVSMCAASANRSRFSSAVKVVSTYLQSTYDAAIADSKATAAAGTAAAAAAAAVPGGNAVAGAAMYAQSAQQAALVARQKPQLDAARSRAMMANANSMADVTAMLQANPRFARLTQLVNAKQCSMPSN